MIFLVLICLFAGNLSLFIHARNESLTRILGKEIYSNSEFNKQYLSSFNNSCLEITDDTITFSGSKKTSKLYSLELLSTLDRDTNEYSIEFNFLYIKVLNLVFIDLYLYDNDNNLSDQAKIYAYPSFTESGYLDIQFDYIGYTFHASDFITDSNSDLISAASGNFFFEDMGDGGSLYPVIAVSTAILGIDDAVSEAQDILPIVTLFDDGPINYIFYIAKLTMIQSNFDHNYALSNPTGLIENQTYYDDFEYGFSNIGDAGCEIVAMYNFLYNTSLSESKPNLATLIALTQLINADMGLGLLGSAPTDDNILGIVENEVSDLIQMLYDQFITDTFIEDVAETMIYYYEQIPSWMTWFFELLVSITVNTIKQEIDLLISSSNGILDYYINHSHSFIEVLSLYDLDGTDTYYDLTDMENHLDESRHFIVSFWNSVNSYGLPIVNDMLHTIYINRESDDSGFVGHNLYLSRTYTEFYYFLDLDSIVAQQKFISGSVIIM